MRDPVANINTVVRVNPPYLEPLPHDPVYLDNSLVNHLDGGEKVMTILNGK